MTQAMASDQATSGNSSAFTDGFKVGFNNREPIGWTISQAPVEETIVETIYTMAKIIPADGYDDYEVRWLAGLIAAWFARGK